MRYPHGFAVTITYATPDGYERALVHTNDALDHRRIKRVIRQWVRKYLGRTLYTHELRLLMKTVIKHNQPTQYMRHRATIDDYEERAAAEQRDHYKAEDAE
ncbi:hypothetical protein EVC00_026 [Rhizobium phage RHph_N37]|uniref:Uncharacterized protein n=1 Tax=Rhizobium phage RHph_N37 TaxID=2509749 RepID=A0A7S5R8V4_9CAUD|nr:hypothetical protein EVC00_026 [Rhizobium phage RHph_N37]